GYHPHQLSGGMQQRVAIARALARQSDILLMDEPFSSLDAMTRAGLQDLLLGLWRDFKKTVVFVTHDVEEAVYLSTSIAVLSARPGRLIETIPNDLPHPRDQLATREDPRFLRCRRARHRHRRRHGLFPRRLPAPRAGGGAPATASASRDHSARDPPPRDRRPDEDLRHRVRLLLPGGGQRDPGCRRRRQGALRH